MAALAAGLKVQGMHVSGSDAHGLPPISENLKALGIPFVRGYSPENLPADADCIVIGNAIRPDNAEAQAALNSGKPCLSMPQAIRQLLMQHRDALAVVGTHGKTTTTSLLAHVLTELGEDPGCLVGGIASGLQGGFRLGKGRWFVVEGDEYDSAFFDKTPKFFKYLPHWAIFTHLEFDHADIYSDLASISEQFARLLASLPAQGLLLACWDVPQVRRLLPKAACEVIGYGFHQGADCHLLDWQADGQWGVFRTCWRGEENSWRIPIPGRYNALNAAAVMLAARHLGHTAENIQRAWESFAGVCRRMEIRGEVGGVLVLDDFAHHPTAVAAAIEAALQAWPERRLWAVFEPRSFTARGQHFQDAFVTAFAQAPHVVLAPAFRPAEGSQTPPLDTQALAQALQAKKQDAHSPPDIPGVLHCLTEHLQAGDLVLIMSNGAFDNLHTRLLAALSKANKQG